LTQPLLRAPGSSLAKELDSTRDQLMSIAITSGIVSGYVAGVYVGHRTFDTEVGTLFWILAATVGVFAMTYAIRKVFRLQETAYRQRLGLDGELAVGEELNQLMRLGYRVFHDVPGRNYNVDHVVVGPNGVFAVETKSHPKVRGNSTAEFDGTSIRYPDCVDSNAVRQGIRQARSVSRYLTAACGVETRVCGVVILPGWYVKQTKRTQGCVVIASGQIGNEIPRLKCEKLDKGQIDSLSHQIERLCRSEAPIALSDEDDLRFSQRPTL
jgi:hypothetical protein